jgi:hypothetical protein
MGAQAIPLLLCSYELWAELDRAHPGILTITGGLMLGTAQSATGSDSVTSARQWCWPPEPGHRDCCHVLPPSLTVERQLLFWFGPPAGIEPFRATAVLIACHCWSAGQVIVRQPADSRRRRAGTR